MRNTIWGDHKQNYRGTQLLNWINNNANTLKLSIFPALNPTYPSSGSYLDYGLLDNRLVLNAENNKLRTAPYDSDYNAIVFSIDSNSIFNGLTPPR